MLRSLFEAQVRLRNGAIRFIGRTIAGIDRRIHSWTASHEHLELDLVAPRSEGQNPLDPVDWFRRLSFPHMAATATVWIDVLLAQVLLPYSEAMATALYFLAALLYPGVFYASTRLRPWLLGHPAGPWIVRGTKGVGLLFGGFSLLLAAIALLFIFIFLAVIWMVVAVLAIIFLPGLGWIAVSSEIKGFFDLLTAKKVEAMPEPPKPEAL